MQRNYIIHDTSYKHIHKQICSPHKTNTHSTQNKYALHTIKCPCTSILMGYCISCSNRLWGTVSLYLIGGMWVCVKTCSPTSYCRYAFGTPQELCDKNNTPLKNHYTLSNTGPHKNPGVSEVHVTACTQIQFHTTLHLTASHCWSAST